MPYVVGNGSGLGMPFTVSGDDAVQPVIGDYIGADNEIVRVDKFPAGSQCRGEGEIVVVDEQIQMCIRDRRSTDKIGRGCLADRIPKEDTHLTIWKGCLLYTSRLAAGREHKIRPHRGADQPCKEPPASVTPFFSLHRVSIVCAAASWLGRCGFLPFLRSWSAKYRCYR